MSADHNSSVKIMHAALTLFSERGYDATSTREICELAGITKPTLYYFYKSKEGIYRALLQNVMQEFNDIARESLQSKGTLRVRLKRATVRIFEDAARRPHVWRLVLAVSHSFDSPFASELHEPYREISELLAGQLRAAARAREIRAGDVNLQLLVLFGALTETICNFIVYNEPKLTRKLAHSLIDTVFDGWLPKKTRA